MRPKTRPWVLAVCTSVVLLCCAVYVLRGSKQAPLMNGSASPPSATTGLDRSPKAVEAREALIRRQPKELESKTSRPAGTQQKWDPEVWGTLPPRSRVMLEDGSIVPAKPGRSKLGDPGVLAEIYDGAPGVAVKRLKGILLSGSNEYAEFTRTEKYPEWVYDEIERRYPGELGTFLAHAARGMSTMDPEMRPSPPLDIGDEDDPYRVLLIGHPGEVAVAETRFGTVGAEVHLLGNDVFNVAQLLAHRIAAGDTGFHTPKVPPPPYRGWLDWVAGSFEPWRLKRELADAGIAVREVPE